MVRAVNRSAEIVSHRYWPKTTAVAVLAFFAGAAGTRVPAVSRLLKRLDWSSVMENVIGAGIPLAITAAIGILIGRKLSLDAAVELHKAVSDLDEERAVEREDIALRRGRRRQELWTKLKVAASDERLRYNAGWQGQRHVSTHPIDELVGAVPAVASAIDNLVADGVTELETTASKLRAIVAAATAARKRLDDLAIVWIGTTFKNPGGHDTSLWSPTLEVFDSLGKAVEWIGTAARVHAVPIDSGPTASVELTLAKDAVDRCALLIGV